MDFLSNFIAGERGRYETRDNNLFASAFSQITRYYQFLHVILKRYDEAGKEFFANTEALRATSSPGGGILTAKQRILHEEYQETIVILHLEIESFYLFAKILLDRVARVIELYFGEARNLSLASHDKFFKNIENYAGAKSLASVSSRFLELAKLLKIEMSDYRDKEIAHEKSPRTIKGTTFNPGTGTSTLMSLKIYPKQGDKQSESKSLKQVMDQIDEYLKETINYMSENRSKTNLKLIS